MDRDREHISPIGLECRPRKGVVDEENAFVHTIGSNVSAGYSEVIITGDP